MVLIEESEVQSRTFGHKMVVFIIHTIQIAKVFLAANKIQALQVTHILLFKQIKKIYYKIF